MTIYASDDTIAAIATPPGEGAIAVLRISGSNAFSVAASIFQGQIPFEKMAPRRLYFGRLVDGVDMVDEGLCAIFRSPASYTGENLVEMSCHGGILVSARILQIILTSGARMANPGEFTQRAFLNGKLDLTQAEGVMDLIRAQTPLALRAAALQLEGAIGQEVSLARSELIEILAHIEAFIDFPEEGIEPDTETSLQNRIIEVRKRLEKLLATATQGRLLREGLRVAICGSPNAGKSSLLNRLLGFDRAIVSKTPGTTRDTIEEGASLGGIPFRLVDTAGIRPTNNPIEMEGVRRAFQAADQADVILHVVDVSQPSPPIPEGLPRDRLHQVWNKTDLLSEPFFPPEGSVAISCATGTGIPILISRIIDWAGGLGPWNSGQSAAINARHQSCLKRACKALEGVQKELRNGVEFAAVELRQALDAVGEVIGMVDHEQILDSIFHNFCIGK